MRSAEMTNDSGVTEHYDSIRVDEGVDQLRSADSHDYHTVHSLEVQDQVYSIKRRRQ